ncbi:MAG: DapH/DapD/GlmU-related protein [Methanosarcinaceae archaeon]|nr:DapH/DapD/GlmU-related protein [Methanosarcinaceae archaeon]
MRDYLTFIRKVFYRVNWCLKKGFPLRMILCDVDLREIPKSTNFGHPIGIVIRGGTVIGENCVIRQNVTIGQKNREDESAVIGNKVDIGAGAIILGPVNIGDDCIIAAGAIVLESVPPRSTYYSKFTSIIKRNG